jgi:hypothetical protein
MIRQAYLVVLAALVPALAQAQYAPPGAPSATGVQIGLRTGYSIPLGDIDGSASMSDVTTGHLPLQLDVGYRTGNLVVGGYLSYGFGRVAGATKDLCDFAGTSCSTRTFRLGGQLLFLLDSAPGHARPWLGVGLGYDSIQANLGSEDLTAKGAEVPFQGGIDWPLGTGGAFGIFGSLGLGRYTTLDSSAGGSGEIGETKMHSWLTLGLRATFGN